MYLGLLIMLLSGATSSEHDVECDNCILEAQCYLLQDFFNRIPFSFYRHFHSRIRCRFKGHLATVCCDEDFLSDVLRELNTHTINSHHKITNQHVTTVNPHVKIVNTNDRIIIHEPEHTKTSTESTFLNKTNNVNDQCEMKESRIIGGVTASAGLFPWMAKLGYTNGENLGDIPFEYITSKDLVYRCGGSLVTLRHVLTAAHCLVGLPNDMVLTVVELDADGDKIRRFPTNIISHPGYSSSRTKDDLGIIELNRLVSLSNTVMPICLPINQFVVDPSKLGRRSLIVAGWGTVRPDSTIMSDRLRYTRLNYMDDGQCRWIYRTRYGVEINDGHLCTVPDGRKDACYGDSGGPLFTWAGGGDGPSAVIVAVVSFGSNICAASDVPPVFTRVSSYMDWIIEHID